MARFAFLCIAVWVLLIAPTLCVGGVLLHACSCATETCDQQAALPCGQAAESPGACTPSEACAHGDDCARDNACGHDDSCGHEDECASDPCQDFIRALSSREGGAPETVAPLAAPSPSFLDAFSISIGATRFLQGRARSSIEQPLAKRFQPLRN
jgi:hypothetical protein